MENYILIIVVAVLALNYYRRFISSNHKNVQNLSAEEAYQLIKLNKEIIVIDVRTLDEYKNGHIPGSKSIPVGELSSKMAELQNYKDKPILVHCASGGRSPAALRILIKNNFSRIYHLKRGLIGWSYGLK
jgi:rhodanese-related sulfurtransferase